MSKNGHDDTKHYVAAEADMLPAVSVQQFWTLTPAAGTPRHAPLDPLFWRHVARKLRPMAEVTIIPQDGLWIGKYIVKYCERTEAVVQELSYHELSEIEEKDSDEYAVEWRGQYAKFCVVRKADNEVMSKGHYPKEVANTERQRLEARRAA